MSRTTTILRAAALGGLLFTGAATLPAQDQANELPKVVEAKQRTAEALLQITRADWQRVDAWLRRSPEVSHYRRWMMLLQYEGLNAQWTKGNAAEPAALRDLEINFKRYREYIDDGRYHQFVASFIAWKAAATRESILKLAFDIRRLTEAAPANQNSNPASYRQRIGTAQAEVRNRLTAFTTQGANDWRRFLRWETLTELSQGNNKLPLVTLQELQVVMRNGVVVWDIPAMQQLQQAINEAAIQAAIDEEEDFPAARKEKLQELAGLVEAFAKSPTNEHRLAIGPSLWWLRSHGELKGISTPLMYHVSIPNFRYETTAGVIERDVNQHLDEKLDVNDTYNGANVRGQARLNANLKASLLPSPRVALWELRMEGTTVSNTNASGQGVNLRARGNTVLSATKKITMDASGMRSQPAVASADADINYENVDASSWGQYQGQALNRVYSSQSSSEFQAERRTESYIAQRLNQDGSKYVRDYNQKYQDNFVYPRARQLSWPHQFQMSSSPEILVMDMLDGPSDSLGAATPAPPSPFEADAYVKSHVTAFDAYGWRKLAGKKLTVTELKKIMHDLGMHDEAAPAETAPKSENQTAEESPAEIDTVAALRAGRTLSFPKQKPIEFTLANGLLTGVSHLEGFASEGKDYDAMTVKFTYRLTSVSSGVEIKRESLEAWPANFVPGSGQRLSGPQLVVRKLLVNVLSDALPQKSTLTHVSGGLGDDMPITQFANLGEWICIGMSIPPQADKPVASVTPKD